MKNIPKDQAVVFLDRIIPPPHNVALSVMNTFSTIADHPGNDTVTAATATGAAVGAAASGGNLGVAAAGGLLGGAGSCIACHGPFGAGTDSPITDPDGLLGSNGIMPGPGPGSGAIGGSSK